MQVTLSGTGPLKRMVREGLSLDLPTGARIRDALTEASARLGDMAPVLQDEEGQTGPGIVVFVNDQMIRRNGADAELSDGDELTVLMPVAGG
ncbi:MAG: MoaD/ThiS family protein [Actinomycetota bacterium]|nr:MoaD/ThiS family protein [Actinomycetota bacterium]